MQWKRCIETNTVCYTDNMKLWLSVQKNCKTLNKSSQEMNLPLMSYSELKHCRLLAFHSRFFVFRVLFFHFSLYLEVTLLLGLTDWLIDWFHPGTELQSMIYCVRLWRLRFFGFRWLSWRSTTTLLPKVFAPQAPENVKRSKCHILLLLLIKLLNPLL